MNIFETIINYFDLRSNSRPKQPSSNIGGNGRISLILQYLVVFFGILIEPLFTIYQQTGKWQLDGLEGRVAFAMIVGFAIMPSVYKNSIDPDKPIFIQLCLLFVAGMGWQSLLNLSTGGTP